MKNDTKNNDMLLNLTICFLVGWLVISLASPRKKTQQELEVEYYKEMFKDWTPPTYPADAPEPNPGYYDKNGIWVDWVEDDEDDSTVTVTQYNPVVEQCDEDPLVTADNSEINLVKLKKGRLRWVAVSRDLRKKYKYGDVIELKVSRGNKRINGRYIVHDTMHPRFRKRIDILTAVGEPMDRWHGVSVIKIEEEV